MFSFSHKFEVQQKKARKQVLSGLDAMGMRHSNCWVLSALSVVTALSLSKPCVALHSRRTWQRPPIPSQTTWTSESLSTHIYRTKWWNTLPVLFCKKICNTCLPLHNLICPKLASEKQIKYPSGREYFSLEAVKITDIFISITLIAESGRRLIMMGLGTPLSPPHVICLSILFFLHIFAM